MPRKSLSENSKYQSAQGMVEFALVLPILLLILFGIIGFGHLFFSYSLVVNASREAARFGSAVGLTESSVPRYRDCDEIRENAVRVGTFAGVENNETSIQIAYDKGPKADGSDADLHPHGCPAGGVGPGYVGLGDRIVVTVTVNYQPIVPLVNIPSFPLTAVTRRTIVLGMPVGEAPVAESLCTGTITRIIPPTWSKDLDGSFSVVGETVQFHAQVIADNPSISAPGILSLYVEDDTDLIPPYTDVYCSGLAPYYECVRTNTWHEIGSHTIRATYVSGTVDTDNPCYVDTRAQPVIHWVLPADTETRILSHDPLPSEQEENVLVAVEVVPLPPGGGIVEGQVVVFEGDDPENHCTITLVANELDIAQGSCELAMTEAGYNSIVAVYDPEDAIPFFNTSSATVDHFVEEKIEPTPTVIPSPTPTTSLTTCPVFFSFADGPYAGSQIDFSRDGASMLLNIRNSGYLPARITSVEVGWPNVADPIVNLNAIQLNSSTLWSSGENTYGPPSQRITSQTPNWNSDVAVVAPETQAQLRVNFSYEMVQASSYSVTVHFDNSDWNFKCSPIAASGIKLSQAIMPYP